MNRYFAVIKMKSYSTPASTSFDAPDTGLALRKMMEVVGVSSTMEIDEYELLEVVGKDYKRVACKGPTRSTPPRPATVVGRLIPETPEPLLTLEETEYTPFTVEVI